VHVTADEPPDLWMALDDLTEHVQIRRGQADLVQGHPGQKRRMGAHCSAQTDSTTAASVATGSPPPHSAPICESLSCTSKNGLLTSGLQLASSSSNKPASEGDDCHVRRRRNTNL